LIIPNAGIETRIVTFAAPSIDWTQGCCCSGGGAAECEWAGG